MERGFTEGDWQLLRKRIPEWQESCMAKLNREYIQLLSEDRSPSEKFWDLEKCIKADKSRAGVRLEMKRSTLIDNIVALINEGTIDLEDLEGFSDELKDTVSFILEKAGE